MDSPGHHVSALNCNQEPATSLLHSTDRQFALCCVFALLNQSCDPLCGLVRACSMQLCSDAVVTQELCVACCRLTVVCV